MIMLSPRAKRRFDLNMTTIRTTKRHIFMDSIEGIV